MSISILPVRLTGSALFLSAAVLLSGCTLTGSAPLPLPSTLPIGTAAPEDITVSGSAAYVSNINDGSVLKLDLAQGGAVSTFVPAATDAYRSAWGLRLVKARNWLLSIQNRPYDFNPANAQAGRLTAYDLSSGAQVRSWPLPAQMVGNSVDVDLAGNIYVGDIGPLPRIVRINPQTNEVTLWATSSQWVGGGFGLGGMVYSGTGLYVSHNNALWYIAVQPDGNAAPAQAVKVAGNPVIFADGMLWTGEDLIYAENDVLVPGAQGQVFRVQFTDPTTATRTTLHQGLSDPSGVALASVGTHTHLLVNESQLGYAFGVDKGAASLPYQVRVLPR